MPPRRGGGSGRGLLVLHVRREGFLLRLDLHLVGVVERILLVAVVHHRFSPFASGSWSAGAGWVTFGLPRPKKSYAAAQKLMPANMPMMNQMAQQVTSSQTRACQ